jgi:AAA family ATP:ADP antiporter
MAPRWLHRLIDLREEELAPSTMGAVYFFCLMFGYFMLRPLRESMGLEGGVGRLRLLFLATLLVMVVVNVGYGWLVANLRRRLFVPLIYRGAIACLLVFTLLLLSGNEPGGLVGRVFYVWLSVFNLLAVSVFWALMADTFTLEQGKRLFGFIGVGGTAGAIAGSTFAWTLAERLGPIGLMILAACLIEAAAQIATRLARRDPRDRSLANERIGGAPWRGLLDVVRNPYLGALGAYVMLYSVLSTLLYFEKMRIVEANVAGADARTSVFAGIELAGQTLTVLIQLFLTGRLMRWFGVGTLLAAVPAVTIAGFAALLLAPTLGVLATFEAVRRASNFALSKPARETLFTVVSRDERYKAKGAIDTFVYRGGDSLGTLADKGAELAALSAGYLAIPIAGVALTLSVWLGFRERARNTQPVDPGVQPATSS